MASPFRGRRADAGRRRRRRRPCLTPRIERLERRRLLAAGDLDPSFGTAGVRTIDWALENNQAHAILTQSDGKVVVAGQTDQGGSSASDFFLMRLNPDGTSDTTFGNNGLVRTDFAGGEDDAIAIAIQSDGKIVAAGLATVGGQKDFGLVRYNTEGTLDASFGTGGKETIDFGGKNDEAFGVAIVPGGTGRIVVAGSAIVGSTADFGLVRLNPDGTLDTSFGTGGKVTTNFGFGVQAARAVNVLADGRIVVAGSALIGSDTDFAVARYLADGRLDTTFGGDGMSTTDFDLGNDVGTSLALQPDGKVLVAGTAMLGSQNAFGVARFDANGTLDTTFDGTGHKEVEFNSSNSTCYAMALQSDGRILLAGTAKIGSNDDFAATRLKADGSVDTSFGSGGGWTHDFGYGDDSGGAATLDAYGRILIAGTADILGDTDVAVVRLLNVLPDRYEPNDSAGSAADLGTVTGTTTYPG